MVNFIAGSIVGRYVLVRMTERRQKKRFVRKLIAELEGIKKDLQKYQPISTSIYDSSISKLLLLSDEVAENVKKTYEELERETVRIALPNDQIKQLVQKINTAINALLKE